MKLLTLFIFLLCFRVSAKAQQDAEIDEEKSSYAVIKDVDGFVNIRKAPNNTALIVGKITNYQIFMVEPNQTNWWKVEQVLHDDDCGTSFLDGYIHKSRVSILPSAKSDSKIIPVKGDSYTLTVDGFAIAVDKKAFNQREHKLLNKGQDKLLIDGKGFWGTDGTIPAEMITSIKITKNGKPIILPYKAYSDCYEPLLETLSFGYGPNNTFFISMSNVNNAAGGYFVFWFFKNDQYYSRYIDNSLD